MTTTDAAATTVGAAATIVGLGPPYIQNIAGQK